MPFQVKSKRREDGAYDLSFGKGSKKLSARLLQIKGPWYVTMNGSNLGPFQMKREAIAAWGQWAAGEYGTANTQVDSDDALPETPPPSEEAGEITWAQAFAFLANAGRPKTETRRNDLIMLLKSLTEEQEKPKHGKTICPPPTFTPQVAEVERESPVEAAPTDGDSGIDSEAVEVSG